MIASEADYQIGLLGLQIDQKFNDATTVGAAIDIITKKNKLGGLLFTGVQLTSFYEVLQLGQAAMNVADGVSPLHGTPMVKRLSYRAKRLGIAQSHRQRCLSAEASLTGSPYLGLSATPPTGQRRVAPFTTPQKPRSCLQHF